MGLWVTSLNSGSNGNCYYVGNEQEAVLIDAGLTCRETEKRMKRLELDIRKVKAIFISHEHGDHIKGVEVISHKYRIPVYITPKTWSHSRLKRLDPTLAVSFSKEDPVTVGQLCITAFPKFHDAADAHSFIISSNNTTIGVFTDLGRVCDPLRHYFARCHAAFLEANYDPGMLHSGRYPYHLKQRISNGFGHLSNQEAFELYQTCRSEQLSHLFLAHLSADNNRPDLALHLFNERPGHTQVSVASRYEPMPLHYISAITSASIAALPAPPVQLALFE